MSLLFRLALSIYKTEVKEDHPREVLTPECLFSNALLKSNCASSECPNKLLGIVTASKKVRGV